MITKIDSKLLETMISSNFSQLTFTASSVRLHFIKFSRLALADFCSLLYNKLQAHSSVISGIWNLSPACSWSSLPYRDLNCLVRVLLSDYLTLYGVRASHVVDAWADVVLSTPFTSFLSISKIDVDLPVSVVTIYLYDGQKFYSESDLWDYVHKQYPQSDYNVSLKF